METSLNSLYIVSIPAMLPFALLILSIIHSILTKIRRAYIKHMRKKAQKRKEAEREAAKAARAERDAAKKRNRNTAHSDIQLTFDDI